MQAYKAKFIKKNGQEREMIFAELTDLPEEFLEQKIVGSGSEKSYPDGMRLVWDLEADNFRVLNSNTLVEPIIFWEWTK